MLVGWNPILQVLVFLMWITVWKGLSLTLNLSTPTKRSDLRYGIRRFVGITDVRNMGAIV